MKKKNVAILASTILAAETFSTKHSDPIHNQQSPIITSVRFSNHSISPHDHNEVHYPLSPMNGSMYNIQITTSPQTNFQTQAMFATKGF